VQHPVDAEAQLAFKGGKLIALCLQLLILELEQFLQALHRQFCRHRGPLMWLLTTKVRCGVSWIKEVPHAHPVDHSSAAQAPCEGQIARVADLAENVCAEDLPTYVPLKAR
jgi:hypothetical protein